jgi:hypothetical protein
VENRCLVTLLGTSGVGKSSVVFAGLIPKLSVDHKWLVAPFRPLTSPFYSLAAALIPHLEPSMSEVDRLKESRKLADNLNRGTIELGATVGRILQKNRESKHFLLVIDQFEEIFTLCPIENDRARFIKALLSTIDQDGLRSTPSPTILLTLRADFSTAHPSVRDTQPETVAPNPIEESARCVTATRDSRNDR